jgi:FdhD protein
MLSYIKRKIIKKQGLTFEETEDSIAVEKKLAVSLNGDHIISLFCTPTMIEELVTGLLITEGILKDKISRDDMRFSFGDHIVADVAVHSIEKIKLKKLRCLGGLTFAGEGPFGKIKDNFSIAAGTVKKLFGTFRRKSELFDATGCFHSAAISDFEDILAFAEDIGRHNAVDKVIGYCILNNISFSKKLMLVSCRVSSEIISKCARWQIPILASRSAPTDQAIEIAEASGITLIGFVRGDRLNIYTHMKRIA